MFNNLSCSCVGVQQKCVHIIQDAWLHCHLSKKGKSEVEKKSIWKGKEQVYFN